MKATKKKIVFFSQDLRIGGMENALVSLLNALAEKQYEITLILESKSGPLLKELNAKIKVKEYHLSCVRFTPIRKLINFSHRMLWSLFNHNHYDFSCNYATYSLLGSKLSIMASKNSALYVHSNYFEYYDGDVSKTKEFFNKINICKFKNIIFVSKESMGHIKKLFPNNNNFIVINNLINPSKIKQLAYENVDLKLDSKNYNLLFVGRLDNSSKDIHLLLNVFKAAYKQNRFIRLFIVGDGPDKQSIEEHILKEDIVGVTLLGEMTNPYPYIKMCDLLVLTSKYEGFPIVYSEALILNKLFVTTVPTSDDFIDVRDYFIITDRNPINIVSAILQTKKYVKNYNIDFDLINLKRLCKIERLINEELYNEN